MIDGAVGLGAGAWLAVQSSSTAIGALVTFLIYTAAVFALAFFSHRLLSKRDFLAEYFLGSRGLGVIALAFSFAATSASAGTFAGFPAFIYAHGWSLALWIASYMIFALTTMGLLGKRLNQIARRTGAITVPDVLRERYDSPALAILATVLLMFLLGFYLIAQFKLGGIILRILVQDMPVFQEMTVGVAKWQAALPFVAGRDPGYLLCLVFFAVLVIFYTSFGGFRAVVWTDILQGVVMVFGVMVMLVLTLIEVGGLERATASMAQMTPPRLGEVTFERVGSEQSAADADVRIPLNTWLWIEPTGQEVSPMLIRTNALAVISAGTFSSSAVKSVQITTPEEIASILAGFAGRRPPALPAGVGARVGTFQPYAYGDGQRGVYVSGPGPSRDDPLGFLPLMAAISFFFFWAISGTGQPGNMVRLMAFDRARTLKRAIAVVTVTFGLIYFPLVVIFCCARVMLPGMDQAPDNIMPQMAMTLADGAGWPWLAGLLIAAPFAAAMSTVDSFMLMISSALVRDVYQRNINPDAGERTIKRLSYVCTVVVGTVIAIAAANPPQFLQYLIIFAGSGGAVTFLFPVALGLYWPRMNRAGAFASMLGGFGLFVGLYIAGFIINDSTQSLKPLGLDPLVWGLASSLTCGIVASLATAAPPDAMVKRFFHRGGGAVHGSN